ncbi:nitroreductase family deazaflavin-dependent oxidoreductase [Saccharomonospora iraqiensis]|uniref:nitroreductase family deazaflavin-dependent oxidoreductase n=1 Tax=Saccharomonospora iraqiensis TaxID=52698 RepID=UPI0003F7C7BC|nr:nitroreductase family deazaflavin-dependent oxidoreductase [Saccharomonospora iraqiensis]
MTDARRYRRPGKLDAGLNLVVRSLTGLGVSLWGTRILSVRGRRSGQWRSTPVNLLTLDGADYLVSPRGHTQWVRNLRAAGDGQLRVGRRVRRFRAVELPDDEKVEILRAYLARWGWEVGRFFDGVDAHSDTADLRAAAPGCPVFRVVTPP